MNARRLPMARAAGRAHAAAQRGASLLFSLLALVALTLAAVALVRSVDTGTLVIGNLGFKLDATSATEEAAERAIAWLDARQAGAALDNTVDNAGYYASSLDTLDAGGNGDADDRVVVDWDGDGCRTVTGRYSRCLRPSPEFATAVTGNRSRYVITRLCSVEGPRNSGANFCAAPPPGAAGLDRNRDAPRVGAGRFELGAGNPYYRIVVRTLGARQTVSLTETIVHF